MRTPACLFALRSTPLITKTCLNSRLSETMGDYMNRIWPDNHLEPFPGDPNNNHYEEVMYGWHATCTIRVDGEKRCFLDWKAIRAPHADHDNGGKLWKIHGDDPREELEGHDINDLDEAAYKAFYPSHPLDTKALQDENREALCAVFNRAFAIWYIDTDTPFYIDNDTDNDDTIAMEMNANGDYVFNVIDGTFYLTKQPDPAYQNATISEVCVDGSALNIGDITALAGVDKEAFPAVTANNFFTQLGKAIQGFNTIEIPSLPDSAQGDCAKITFAPNKQPPHVEQVSGTSIKGNETLCATAFINHLPDAFDEAIEQAIPDGSMHKDIRNAIVRAVRNADNITTIINAGITITIHCNIDHDDHDDGEQSLGEVIVKVVHIPADPPKENTAKRLKLEEVKVLPPQPAPSPTPQQDPAAAMMAQLKEQMQQQMQQQLDAMKQQLELDWQKQTAKNEKEVKRLKLDNERLKTEADAKRKRDEEPQPKPKPKPPSPVMPPTHVNITYIATANLTITGGIKNIAAIAATDSIKVTLPAHINGDASYKKRLAIKHDPKTSVTQPKGDNISGTAITVYFARDDSLNVSMEVPEGADVSVYQHKEGTIHYASIQKHDNKFNLESWNDTRLGDIFVVYDSVGACSTDAFAAAYSGDTQWHFEEYLGSFNATKPDKADNTWRISGAGDVAFAFRNMEPFRPYKGKTMKLTYAIETKRSNDSVGHDSLIQYTITPPAHFEGHTFTCYIKEPTANSNDNTINTLITAAGAAMLKDIITADSESAIERINWLAHHGCNALKRTVNRNRLKPSIRIETLFAHSMPHIKSITAISPVGLMVSPRIISLERALLATYECLPQQIGQHHAAARLVTIHGTNNADIAAGITKAFFEFKDSQHIHQDARKFIFKLPSPGTTPPKAFENADFKQQDVTIDFSANSTDVSVSVTTAVKADGIAADVSFKVASDPLDPRACYKAKDDYTMTITNPEKPQNLPQLCDQIHHAMKTATTEPLPESTARAIANANPNFKKELVMGNDAEAKFKSFYGAIKLAASTHGTTTNRILRNLDFKKAATAHPPPAQPQAPMQIEQDDAPPQSQSQSPTPSPHVAAPEKPAAAHEPAHFLIAAAAKALGITDTIVVQRATQSSNLHIIDELATKVVNKHTDIFHCSTATISEEYMNAFMETQETANGAFIAFSTLRADEINDVFTVYVPIPSPTEGDPTAIVTECEGGWYERDNVDSVDDVTGATWTSITATLGGTNVSKPFREATAQAFARFKQKLSDNAHKQTIATFGTTQAIYLVALNKELECFVALPINYTKDASWKRDKNYGHESISTDIARREAFSDQIKTHVASCNSAKKYNNAPKGRPSHLIPASSKHNEAIAAIHAISNSLPLSTDEHNFDNTLKGAGEYVTNLQKEGQAIANAVWNATHAPNGTTGNELNAQLANETYPTNATAMLISKINRYGDTGVAMPLIRQEPQKEDYDEDDDDEYGNNTNLIALYAMKRRDIAEKHPGTLQDTLALAAFLHTIKHLTDEKTGIINWAMAMPTVYKFAYTLRATNNEQAQQIKGLRAPAAKNRPVFSIVMDDEHEHCLQIINLFAGTLTAIMAKATDNYQAGTATTLAYSDEARQWAAGNGSTTHQPNHLYLPTTTSGSLTKEPHLTSRIAMPIDKTSRDRVRQHATKEESERKHRAIDTTTAGDSRHTHGKHYAANCWKDWRCRTIVYCADQETNFFAAAAMPQANFTEPASHTSHVIDEIPHQCR